MIERELDAFLAQRTEVQVREPGSWQEDTLLRQEGERRRRPSLDLLIAGLGNPDRKYERTRHNAVWLVVDELARRHEGSFRSKFNGHLAEIRIDGKRVALLKPETYMN